MRARNLRQKRPAPAHAGSESRSDVIEREIRRLVIERQELRGAGASAAELERNRLEIARLQRELARALVAVYLPQAQESAA
jgi:hypothetical protein